MRSATRPWAGLLAGLLTAAAPAAAQTAVTVDCRTHPIDPCTDTPPRVSVSIPFEMPRNEEISVWLSDDFALYGGITVSIDGVTKGVPFTWTTQPTEARSIFVPWSDGTMTVTARDTKGQTTTVQREIRFGTTTTAATYAKPAVSTSPHHGAFRNVAQSSATLAYTTPAYVTRGEARAATLVYASGQAYPRGLVQVDATDASTVPAHRVSFSLRTAAGAAVTLHNGATEIFYAGTGKQGETYRLAAGFNASSLATGAYAYTAVVRFYWLDAAGGVSRTEETSTPVTVLVVNERSSPFGTGWSMPGLQRLHVMANQDVVLTPGDGTAWLYARNADGTYTRPEGNFARLTYSASTSQYTLAYPDNGKAYFNAAGRITGQVGPLGANQATNFFYSGSTLTSIRDVANKSTTFAYAGGRLTSITDPGGRRTDVTHDAAGDVRQITGPDGVVALAPTYTSMHLLTRWTDRDGKIWDVGYASQAVTLARMDAPADTFAGVLQRPRTSQTALEAALFVTGATSLASPAAAKLLAHARWTTTDANGNTTTTTVDRFGLSLRITGPLGTWTTISRDENGLPDHVSDATGRGEGFSWDADGRLRSRWSNGTGESTTISYDSSRPWLVKTVVQNGYPTSYRYSARGEVTSIRRGSDPKPDSLVYDAWSRVRTMIDGAGNRTEYFYDGTPWQNADSVRVTSPGKVQVTRYAYGAYGRTEAVTNPLGQTTRYGYDPLDRVVTQTDAAGKVTAFAYNPLRFRVTDATGKYFEYTYNTLGQVESERHPGNIFVRYTYDRNGNVLSVTDRRGKVVGFTYDALNRPLTRVADGATTTFGYDNSAGTSNLLGEWISAQNAEATEKVFFDRLGRPDSTVITLGGQTYGLRSTYGPTGQRVGLTMTRPWARSVGWQYSPAGRLEGITDFGGATATVSYDDQQRPKSVTFPGGAVRSYTYTADHLVSRSSFSVAALNTAFGATFTYDPLDRLRSATGILPLDQTAQVRGRTYTYDAVGRLNRHTDSLYTQQLQTCGGSDFTFGGCTWGTTGVTSQQVASRSYTYDAVGNRTDLASIAPGTNKYTTAGGFTLTYDLDGNLTRKYKAGVEDRSFTWNALGQLTRVVDNLGGTTTTYGYDGFGKRVRRTVGTAVTRYLYDQGNLLMEIEGSRVREFTHHPGTDRPHAMREVVNGFPGASHYYATDWTGNVIGLFKTSGQVSNTYRYTPFGEAEQASETVSNPFRFMAREWDQSAGLYYVRARWYDPQLRRFVSEDPIGLEGGINMYAYALNDPVNRRDPSGLNSCSYYGEGDDIWVIGIVGCATQKNWHFSIPAAQGWSNSFGNRGSALGGCCETGERPNAPEGRPAPPTEDQPTPTDELLECVPRMMRAHERYRRDWGEDALQPLRVETPALFGPARKLWDAYLGWAGAFRLGMAEKNADLASIHDLAVGCGLLAPIKAGIGAALGGG